MGFWATPATSTFMTYALVLAQRSPKRLTITVPYGVYDSLVRRSSYEGRSLSNLASYLLELALAKDGSLQLPPIPKRWGDQR